MADHDEDGRDAARSSSPVRTADAEEWEKEFGAVVDSVAKGHQLIQYVEDERTATAIHSYEPEQMPGLLQVPEYVQAMTRIYFPDATEAERAALVDARLDRVAFLDLPGAPQLTVLLGEGALRREWDPSDARRKQLDALIRDLDGDRPSVDLRIVPMGLGHPDALSGAFVVMSFPDGSQVLWREGRHGSERIVSPVEIERAVMSFRQLGHAAYKQPTAQDLIKEIRRSLR